MKFFLGIVILALLTTGTPVLSEESFQFSLPNYEYYQLENGFEVILVENHTNPIVASIVVTRTGLRNETPADNGVSHMLEHLTFNGTRRRTQEQLYDELDYYGIYLNAQTSEDYTTYMALNHKDQADISLDIMSDMLFYSTFPEEKFEKEKGIIVEEIRKDSENPDFKKEQALRLAFYKNPPYSLPVIGTIESVQNMSRDQVTAYYQKYYRPNNMIGMIIGDFQKAEMFELIKKYFGTMPARTIPSRTIEPVQDFPFFYVQEDKKERNIYLKLPAPTFHSDLFIPFQFFYAYSFNEKTGSIVRELKAQSQLHIQKIQSTYEFHPEFATLTIKVTSDSSGDVEQIKKAVIQEFERQQTTRMTAEEVQAIKQSEAISEILESDKILYYGFLKAQELAIGGRQAFEAIIPGMMQATEKRINNFIQNYTRSWSNPVKLYTESHWAENVNLKKYRHKMVSSDRSESRIYRHTFANGLTVLHLHNTDNSVLSLHLLFKNRSAWEPAGKEGMADFLHHSLFHASGKYPADQLQLELQKIGAEIKAYDWDFIPYDDYYNVPEYSYIRVLTLDQFFDKALDIVADNVIFPDLTSDLENVKQQMTAIAGREQASASKTARIKFFKMLMGEDHPLTATVSGNPASLQSIQPDELQSFHHEYFSAGNTILTIVSGIDSATVFRTIDQYFRDMPVTPREVSIPPITVTAENKKDSLELGTQQAYIYLGYSFTADPQDEVALRVMNDMVSTQIAFTLREEKGWAYRLGSTIDSWKGNFYFYTSMGTGRQTTHPAIDGILQEINRFRSSSVTEKQLERTKNSLQGALVRRRASRESQAYTLGLNEYYRYPTDYFFSIFGDIKKVSLMEVERLKNQHLQTNHYLLFYTIPVGQSAPMKMMIH